MKYKFTAMVAVAAALTLAGCSQQNNHQSTSTQTSQNSKNNQASSTSGSNNNNTSKLSAEDLDYKTTASAITVYAAQKYGDTWEIALNAAKDSDNLGVAFRSKSATGISSDNSGYVYEVSGTGKSSNARYMLSGDGADREITIFVKQRDLGTVSLSNIVKYINDHKDANLVNQLAKKTKLDVKLEGDSDTQGSQSSSTDSVIPASLQGTWYTADTGNGNIDILTITNNKINDEAGFSMNVKAENSGNTTTSGYMKQTTINGINFYSFTNMGQNPGQGSTYLAPHTENGQSVIVSANSNGRTNAVYWKSENLAKQNSNKQFSDLQY